MLLGYSLHDLFVVTMTTTKKQNPMHGKIICTLCNALYAIQCTVPLDYAKKC